MNCRKVRSLLSAYLDGEVIYNQKNEIDSHLKRCELCRMQLFDLKQALESLGRLPGDDPGPEFNKTVFRKIEQQKEKDRIIARRMKPVAAFAVLMLLVVLAIPIYVANMHRLAPKHNVYVIARETLIPGSLASMRVVVANKGAENPVKNSKVTLMLAARNGKKFRLLTGRTNNAGTLDGSFRVPADFTGKCKLIAAASVDGRKAVVDLPVKLERIAKVMLTTDKPVYQPGQVIHIRSLALLKPSQKPAAGRINYIIEDPKGNKMLDTEIETNKWGIASTDFALGEELNLGDYKIKAVLGETKSERTVTVERYVLPKFKVSVETDKAYYLPGETVKGTVTANYFFGKPVQGANIKIDASAMEVSYKKFIEVTGRTDETGTFTFETKIPAVLAGQPVARGNGMVRFAARVTDSAKHSEEIGKTVPVSSSPITITVVPESGNLVANLENNIYIVTSYPDGKPAQTDVAVTMEGYKDKAKSDRLGISNVFYAPTTDNVRMTVHAVTSDGKRASKKFTIPCRIGSGEMPYIYGYPGSDRIIDPETVDTVLIRTDKSVYKVGDTARIVALTTKDSGSLYFDAVLDGQTALTKTIPIKNGRAETELDLSGDQAGTLTFTAYVLSSLGSPISDSGTVLVKPAGGLKLVVTPDKKAYTPGDSAKIGFTVTDKSGRGVPAAIGVNIVDESVFSVQEQAQGLAALYFALQKEILEPKYQTEFYTHDVMEYGYSEDSEEYARKAEMYMLRTKRVKADLPSWLNVDSVFSNDREAAIQRAAKVLFASASDPKNPVALVATDQISLKRVEGIQTEFFGYNKLIIRFFVMIAFLFILGSGIYVSYRNLQPVMLCISTLALVSGAIYHYVRLSTLVNSTRGSEGIFWLYACALLTVVIFAMLARRYNAWKIAAISVVVVMLLGLAIVFPTFGRAREAARRPSGVRPYTPSAAPMLSSAPMPGAVAKTSTPDLDNDLTLRHQISGEGGESYNEEPAKPVRVRQFFPETLYSNPSVITDGSGRGEIGLTVADSITNWRVSALASSMNGEIGSADSPLRVFQDFFIDLDLPVAVTQGDSISIPVALYNYLPREQEVRMTLKPEPWFEIKGENTKLAKLAPNQVIAVYFPVKITKLGKHTLTVEARSDSAADAIKKDLTVNPNGEERNNVISGVLSKNTSATVNLPAPAIKGASKLLVKLQPGALSQVVDGLDSLLGVPYGCFEQTSSITYPNILVLKYLNAANKDNPKIRMKAEQYINMGYQRLLTFEVAGGGFDWYGGDHANTILTAYGVMMFADMADVIKIDKRVIKRAVDLLERRQASDGSWRFAEFGNINSISSDVTLTAYVAWALSEAGYGNNDSVRRAIGYLNRRIDEDYDPYTVALIANAMVSSKKADASAILSRLAKSAKTKAERASWSSKASTLTNGYGNVARTETTALAACAFLASGNHPELAGKSLNELIATRNQSGGWETTQSTVLALKALCAGSKTGKMGKGDIKITVNGKAAGTIKLNGSNSDVTRIADVTEFAQPGANRINIQATGDARPAYQVVSRYFMPWPEIFKPKSEPLAITVNYGKLKVEQDGIVDVSATIKSNSGIVKMAIVDLGLAPGFAVVKEDLESLRTKMLIDRYEVAPRQIILYLRDIKPNKPVKLNYRLRALYPVKATVPASRAYDYYNPGTVRGTEKPVVIEVSGA